MTRTCVLTRILMTRMCVMTRILMTRMCVLTRILMTRMCVMPRILMTRMCVLTRILMTRIGASEWRRDARVELIQNTRKTNKNDTETTQKHEAKGRRARLSHLR